MIQYTWKMRALSYKGVCLKWMVLTQENWKNKIPKAITVNPASFDWIGYAD